MPDCDYCGEHVEGEDAYLDHLRSEHEGELGPIDRRRVGKADDGGSDLPTGPIALGVIIVAAAAIVGYTVFAGGSGGDSTRGPVGSAHGHGTINMTVLGDRVDFSREKYQLQARKFHFERGNGRIWHVHATGVTLKWAMSTLDIGVTRDSVTYNGTTYRDGSSKYEVRVTVNGNPVDPSEYVLRGVSFEKAKAGEGPHVRIVVRRA